MSASPKVVAAGAASPLAGQMSALAACLRPLAGFMIAALAVMTVSRLFLAWRYSAHLAVGPGLAEVMGRAWHFDLVVVSAALFVVALVLWLAPSRFLESTSWRLISAAWMSLWLMLIVWNEAATPDFVAEFGVRPNRLYVEYLDTPKEVFLTIWESHRTALAIGIVLTAFAGVLAWRRFHARMEHPPWWPLRLVALFPVLLVLGIGARGGTGHRPLNISFAASSTDPLVNDLALNSTYSAVHSLIQLRREDKVIAAYGRLPEEEVLSRVRAGMQLPQAAFDDPTRPSSHLLVPTARLESKPNLVILLQESLGAHYFKSLGGQPVVQKLEAWQTRSLWFDQLYASGTRSARGLEAVVSGFLPTRTPSVLKMEGAQHEFFTLAQALKEQGYSTEFIYGGDSSFDNMRRFFLGNGFERVLDQSDLAAEAGFQTTWGVSDEDLYARVQREASEHARSGRPFFILAFSTSNHPPYDFPDGRIELYEQPKMTQNNAARYADFAVGSYLETAERSPYWANSLFMVVADHESRSYGEGLVPIFSFHIPAFIAGGPVEPRIVSRIASQTDLVPTVLSLMGISARIPATGIDQSRDDLTGPGRAIMQAYDNAAYRVGNEVVMLAPGQPPLHYSISGQTLAAAPPDTELERDALAHTQWPVMAYSARWYR